MGAAAKRPGAGSALRTVHLWLGWILAAWLGMMALTGAVLLAKPQILALGAPPCAAGTPAELARALATVDQRYPGRVRVLAPASGALCHHEVTFKDQQGGAYVDPASLRTVETWGRNERPTDVVLELHRHLLLREKGKLPTAILAGGTLALVALGLIQALRHGRSLSLRVWPLALTPGGLIASHRNLGVLLALPLAFLALSGWAMTYPKSSQALVAAALGEPAPKPRARPKPAAGAGQTDLAPDWVAVTQGAARAFPGLAPRLVSWPNAPGGPVTVRFRQPGEWQPKGQSTATLAARDGRLLARFDARAASRSFRVWGALYPLHAGRAPPLVGLVVLAAVATALLGAAAGGLWANLLRRTRPPHPAAAPAKAPALCE